MSLPVVVFVAYFLVLFAIGIQSARMTRGETDYWIAGGNLGWLVGGATLAATHASAGTFIGVIGVIYATGWSFAWLVLSIPLAYWFMAAVLAPRFLRVKELTLPAFLERRYDSRGVRALGAAIILVASVVYIQAQILSGGLIANVVLGVPVRWGMIGFALVLILYTMIGGMIAVVYTDLVQLFVMAAGAAIAAPLALQRVGGLQETFAWVTTVEPRVFSWSALPPTLLLTMGLAFLLGSVATPEKLIRLYAMRDLRTVRRGILFAVLATTLMNFLIFFVALAAIVLFPGLDTGDQAMPMIARSLLPPLLGALLLAAITSAMMSTVDSVLLVAGSALSFDLYQNLVHPGATPGRRMLIDRLGVVLAGTAPLLLLLVGVGEGELVQFIVLLFTALMAASFFVPVVVGVYWRRANRQGAFAAMLGGVTTVFLWEAWGPTSIDPVLPGFLVSLVAMVTVSLLTPPSPEHALAPWFPPGAKRR